MRTDHRVIVVSLILLALAITPTFASSKLYLVQRIAFVQCDNNNQTCVLIADGITERELAVIPPDQAEPNAGADEQHPYGHNGNPFIGEHAYTISN